MAEPKDEKAQKKSFKDTLNLPQTAFPIRPNPSIDDPAMVRRWQEEKLFDTSFTCNEGREKFILHDGPPYANGHIHLGTAYNKTLKDIICKSQRMSGKHVPVTPGWDCHGLPIELKVTKEHPGLAPEALKKQCRAYAQKWIDIQREEFKRLGVLMQWDKPYLTMNPSYESSILRALAEFIAKGYIEKKNKTVPWCMSCKTVLASAEIEYHDRKDPSIYVRFPLASETVETLIPSLAGKSVAVAIWTTTPWTLPLNRAVLANPEAEYVILQTGDTYIIVGKSRADEVCEAAGIEKQIAGTIAGHHFKGMQVQHPFIDDLQVPIILDGSVSTSDGTAFVHCAPGCGPEDYEIGVKEGIDIFSPVGVDGVYTKGIEPEELVGVSITDAQGWVIKKLLEVGALVAKKSIKHSYPHCWRCRNGLIFRATRQWFLSLSHDNLKETVLEKIKDIEFLPEKTFNYLNATIRGRLEWCLSRQRTWGVPIPALLCTHCDYAFTSEALVLAVSEKVAEQGIEYWDRVSVEELLQNISVNCPECESNSFVKETDILDVWFDAGVSHFAVLYDNPALSYPADMYAEGIDQHRGWFQSSLLTSVALEGAPSMKMILTHGYTVDDKGHKMSKSLGNVVAPQEIIDKIGTDGLRLWTSSADRGSDPSVSDALLRNVSEVFRKVRNTCRFLLSNLDDFDIENDAVPLEKMLLIDRYALEQLFQANVDIQAAYAEFDMTSVFHKLADYCAKDLSSLYLDVIKDRLYCGKVDSVDRRSAQTACWYILDTLTRLIAPIMSFTAEQVSDLYQKNKTESIHLQQFSHLKNVWILMAQRSTDVLSEIDWYPLESPAQEAAIKIREISFFATRSAQWQMLLTIRSALLKAIEGLREKGIIKHPLEAQITMYLELPKKERDMLNDFFEDLEKSGQSVESFFREFLVVSQFTFARAQAGLQETDIEGLWVAVGQASGIKCPRCWQFDQTDNPDGLCRRCIEVIG